MYIHTYFKNYHAVSGYMAELSMANSSHSDEPQLRRNGINIMNAYDFATNMLKLGFVPEVIKNTMAANGYSKDEIESLDFLVFSPETIADFYDQRATAMLNLAMRLYNLGIGE